VRVVTRLSRGTPLPLGLYRRAPQFTTSAKPTRTPCRLREDKPAQEVRREAPVLN
jgi:hypothetical protein